VFLVNRILIIDDDAELCALVTRYLSSEGYAVDRATIRQRKTGRPVKFEELRGPGHYQMGGYVESLQRGGRWIAAQWGQ